MFKIALIAVAATFVVLLIVIAMQPSDFRVVRTATIAAPAAAVFDQVNNLHNWEAWSPWAKMDPGMKKSFEGPAAGIGAVHAWSGNNQVGEGRMTITESRPNELVRLNLQFLKPFAATNTGEFTFEAKGDQTVVTWSMDGESNFVCKAMHLVMNVDKMIGGQFEQGLASIKAIVENAPPVVTQL